MKFILIFGLLAAVTNSAFCNGILGLHSAQNKTKRTVAGLVQSYGESRPVILYSDGPPPAQSPQGFYRASVFDSVDTPPKQVAAQQVLYEYQQTPTNAVSNVHVNQFYQPLSGIGHKTNPHQLHQVENQNYDQPQQPKPSTSPSPVGNNNHFAETVASPVQHSTLVRHGQNFGQIQFQPLGAASPHHIQTQQYVPGKYLYVNGKITYPQPTIQPQLAYHYPHQNHQLYQNQQNNQQQVKPQTFYNPFQQNQQVLHQRLQAPAPPVNFKQFHPPQRHQMQKITKPMGVPAEETPEEEEAPEEVDEEAAPGEEEAEEDPGYETDEENDEGERYFGRYSFDEEDDPDHYVEDGAEGGDEEEEDDSDRGQTKHVPSKSYHKNKKHPSNYRKGNNNKPQKYNNGKDYKYSESFSTSSKYDSARPKKNKLNKKSKGNNKKASPKMQYRSMKYSRQIGKSPRNDRIESNPSENIPVVHKQKILREKWYVTKSSEEAR